MKIFLQFTVFPMACGGKRVATNIDKECDTLLRFFFI